MLPLHVALASPDTAPSVHPLAQIAYGASTQALLAVPLEVLAGAPIEVWTAEGETRVFEQTGLRAHYTEHALMLSARIQPDEAAFEDRIRSLYVDVVETTRALGFPHILRIWNYLPHITAPSYGLDFYQRFNRARAQALEGRLAQWPAATAVGTDAGEVCVYLLAAKQPGQALENPRQVSAYHYPDQYGPKKPLFARAMVKHWGDVTHIYISGTASVLGHASRHAGDVLAQLDEALRNIEALLEASPAISQPLSLRDLRAVKVYLAHAKDAPAVQGRLNTALPNEAPLLLRADLCRKELLVEIEGIALKRELRGRAQPEQAGGAVSK